MIYEAGCRYVFHVDCNTFAADVLEVGPHELLLTRRVWYGVPVAPPETELFIAGRPAIHSARRAQDGDR